MGALFPKTPVGAGCCLPELLEVLGVDRTTHVGSHEKCNKLNDEAEDEEPGRLPPAPAEESAQMQVDAEHQPGDQRPRLDWIPPPVAPPRLVRPDRPRQHADPPEDEAEAGEAVGVDVDPRQVGKLVRQPLQPVPLDQQVEEREGKGDDDRGKGDLVEDDVQDEPDASEGGRPRAI